MSGLSKSFRRMTLLSVKHIDVSLGQKMVLSDVSLSIQSGEIVTIVGPNGSGKSTLLRAIVGAVPIARGVIAKVPNLRIGYVPQTLHIDRTLPLTVARFLSLPRHQDIHAVHQTLELVELDNLADRPMTDLSGGQFQRVLLARAILTSPNLFILDEPTQGMDQQGSAAFYRLIEDLRQKVDCAVLMVSHELHVVMSASDRVICLNGHVCCQGAPDVVASAPEYRALFGSGTQGALALYRHDHNHNHHDDLGGH